MDLILFVADFVVRYRQQGVESSEAIDQLETQTQQTRVSNDFYIYTIFLFQEDEWYHIIAFDKLVPEISLPRLVHSGLSKFQETFVDLT